MSIKPLIVDFITSVEDMVHGMCLCPPPKPTGPDERTREYEQRSYERISTIAQNILRQIGDQKPTEQLANSLKILVSDFKYFRCGDVLIQMLLMKEEIDAPIANRIVNLMEDEAIDHEKIFPTETLENRLRVISGLAFEVFGINLGRYAITKLFDIVRPSLTSTEALPYFMMKDLEKKWSEKDTDLKTNLISILESSYTSHEIKEHVTDYLLHSEHLTVLKQLSLNKNFSPELRNRFAARFLQIFEARFIHSESRNPTNYHLEELFNRHSDFTPDVKKKAFLFDCMMKGISLKSETVPGKFIVSEKDRMIELIAQENMPPDIKDQIAREFITLAYAEDLSPWQEKPKEYYLSRIISEESVNECLRETALFLRKKTSPEIARSESFKPLIARQMDFIASVEALANLTPEEEVPNIYVQRIYDMAQNILIRLPDQESELAKSLKNLLSNKDHFQSFLCGDVLFQMLISEAEIDPNLANRIAHLMLTKEIFNNETLKNGLSIFATLKEVDPNLSRRATEILFQKVEPLLMKTEDLPYFMMKDLMKEFNSEDSNLEMQLWNFLETSNTPLEIRERVMNYLLHSENVSCLSSYFSYTAFTQELRNRFACRFLQVFEARFITSNSACFATYLLNDLFNRKSDFDPNLRNKAFLFYCIVEGICSKSETVPGKFILSEMDRMIELIDQENIHPDIKEQIVNEFLVLAFAQDSSPWQTNPKEHYLARIILAKSVSIFTRQRALWILQRKALSELNRIPSFMSLKERQAELPEDLRSSFNRIIHPDPEALNKAFRKAFGR